MMIPLFETVHHNRQKILSMLYLFYPLFLVGVAGLYHDIHLRMIAYQISFFFLRCFEILVSHYLELLYNDSRDVLLSAGRALL